MKMVCSQRFVASGPADCNVRSGCDTANIIYTSSDSADEQRAWYAKMYEEQGPDDMKSEYPSCIEECFHSSLEGSYFQARAQKARNDRRIGLPLPLRSVRPVRFGTSAWTTRIASGSTRPMACVAA